MALIDCQVCRTAMAGRAAMFCRAGMVCKFADLQGMQGHTVVAVDINSHCSGPLQKVRLNVIHDVIYVQRAAVALHSSAGEEPAAALTSAVDGDEKGQLHKRGWPLWG